MPGELNLYGLYVYYVVHICDFGMLRVNGGGGGGAQKIMCAYTYHECEVHLSMTKVQGPLKGPESSQGFLCSLVLSEPKLDTRKHSWSKFRGGGGRGCAPAVPSSKSSTVAIRIISNRRGPKFTLLGIICIQLGF